MTLGRNLPIEVAALSDVGRVRSNNEDSYLVYLPPNQEAEALGIRAVFVVADGMGGHALGELASQTAVKAFTEALFSALTKKTETMEQALRFALNQANNAVYQLAQGEGKGRPGTTLTALIVSSDSFYVAHVGDSRAYLLRDGQIRQLTTDHTWIAQEVAKGRIKPHEARNSPFRNYLTNALGSKPTVEGDTIAGGLKEGDVFLLCSDGLTEHVRDHELENLLKNSESLQETCSRMVALANERGGHDNITVLLVQVGLRQTAQPITSLSQGDIPTQPFIPKPTIKKRKRIQWEQVLLMALLAVAIGIGTRHVVEMWKQARSHQQIGQQKILKPQEPFVPAKPPIHSIILQVELQPEGILFTAQWGKIEAKMGRLSPKKRDNSIFVRFNYPHKSYPDLTSGKAIIVLKRGNDQKICPFQNRTIHIVQLEEGEWEVRYIVEPSVDLLLCTLRISKNPNGDG